MRGINNLFIQLLALLATYSFAFAQDTYYVNLSKDSTHFIRVTIVPEKLSSENNVYQFASTAPGTYQTMDIGRFVRQFRAFDASGSEITTTHSSLNQWSISEPSRVQKIEFAVSTTMETPVDSNVVYPMCGSSLQYDNALLNGQTYVGYFKGKQYSPVRIKFVYPQDWTAGTALEKDSDGFYRAESFDKVVDSPVLLGNLTHASMNADGTDVEVYTYSNSGIITSDSMMSFIKDILHAESEFMGGLPVKKYTFLFHFGKMSYGAWEHSYSSDYTMEDQPLSPGYKDMLRTIVAHEFYHIFTPLTLHSELIEHFNYEKPVMSQHLWLYEGVTEWAANMMMLRTNMISLDDYLKRMSEKLAESKSYGANVSLRDLGVNSVRMQRQYADIYARGAIVAGLLDLRLLELSKGKRGLREVLHDLSQEYGINKSFSEATFFDDFTRMTYPEIKDFFNRYIIGNEPLPVKEYFSKVGIEYQDFAGYDSSRAYSGLSMMVSDNMIVVSSIDSGQSGVDIKKGDVVFKVYGDTLTLQNAMQKTAVLRKLQVGDELQLTLLRDKMPHDVTLKMLPVKRNFIFKEDPMASPEELSLREAWMSLK
ncbi:MAG: peptidase [Ignavibacteria bacterium]|nr:peptidase [Ignavibacteria bacterium]MCU7504584.1 peptidase [Ignavibacteria bacterium]MCU7516578.1 peptidase [Ignavibacteria bacterium]